MCETVEEQMIKHRKFTNVQTAKDILDTRESWASSPNHVKLHVKIGFNADDGTEYVTDISNMVSITELSAYLRRADIKTYVLFYIITLDEKPMSPLCVVWTKKEPNTWFIKHIS